VHLKSNGIISGILKANLKKSSSSGKLVFTSVLLFINSCFISNKNSETPVALFAVIIGINNYGCPKSDGGPENLLGKLRGTVKHAYFWL